MNIDQRVDNLDKDVRELRSEMTELRLDVTEIKTKIPYLATKEEVARSRNVIIYWLIGLFVATGIYSHFPLATTAHDSSKSSLSQAG